jgi:acyl carrier protein
MTNGEIRAAVAEIVTGAMNLEVSGPDTDLVAAGQLDSLSLVDLLLRLEQRFGIAVSLDGVEIDDLRSIASIAGLVEKRLEAA